MARGKGFGGKNRKSREFEEQNLAGKRAKKQYRRLAGDERLVRGSAIPRLSDRQLLSDDPGKTIHAFVRSVRGHSFREKLHQLTERIRSLKQWNAILQLCVTYGRIVPQWILFVRSLLSH